MSCICYCDEDDCRNTSEDIELYDLSWEKTKPLSDFLRKNGHICKECLENIWLVDYPDLIIKYDVYGILLNPDFQEK